MLFYLMPSNIEVEDHVGLGFDPNRNGDGTLKAHIHRKLRSSPSRQFQVSSSLCKVHRDCAIEAL